MSVVDQSLIIERASVEVSEAVCALVVRQMAAVLVQHSVADLADDDACERRLLSAGFSSLSVFRLGSDARFEAWAFLEPSSACRLAYHNWLMACRKVPVSSSMFARQ